MASVPPRRNKDGSEAPLTAVPEGVSYDTELERVCRIAASIGAQRGSETPISFTALLGAFLLATDDVSRWFQEFVSAHNIDLRRAVGNEILTAANTSTILARADQGILPDAEQMFSTSSTRIMTAARDVHRLVTGDQAPVLGTRHVLAAYAIYPPADHLKQMEGWGFAPGVLTSGLMPFLQGRFSEEDWRSWLEIPSAADTTAEASQAAAPTPRMLGLLVGHYTPDQPGANSIDLLDVKEEAAAFARIIAARSVSPPLAIGVFGDWGAGKTYFMRSIETNVGILTKAAAEAIKLREEGPANKAPRGKSDPLPADNLFLEDIVQIRFDAWHYAETNLWASLVEYIFAELDRWILLRVKGDHTGADIVFDRLATAQQLKLDALEEVVRRRTERRSAEIRATRAREAYESALARSKAVQPDAYLRALLQVFFDRPANKAALTDIGDTLGIPELQTSSAKMNEVLAEARTEAGKARLAFRASVSKLGSFGAVATILVVLVGLPVLAAWLQSFAAGLPSLAWARSIHTATTSVAAFLAGLAGLLSVTVKHVRAGLAKLNEFDHQLQKEVDELSAKVEHSKVGQEALNAERELQKQRQSLEAAQKALGDADANLIAARQDFETGTARARLTQFIRAKVTAGDYAKHLGIIATIRRDFSQLAALMANASHAPDEVLERDKLENDAHARVTVFLSRLEQTPDLKLTANEFTSLFALLEPKKCLEVFNKNKPLLQKHLEGNAGEITQIEKRLQQVSQVKPPRFTRIVLYIDDLDRCEPEKVVQVLQAVHLLLCFPLFVVVVAVDARWVSRALRQQYPGLLREPHVGRATTNGNGNGREPAEEDVLAATSHDYLEKIFQIPYWVRPMDEAAARKYVAGIARRDGLVQSAGQTSTRTANVASENVVNGNATGASATGVAASSNTSPPPPSSTASNANVDGAAASAPPPPPAPTVAQTVWEGMTLTDPELKLLERFSPWAGSTPRRATRFVNTYRLIKTSLPPPLLAELIGTSGESHVYRTLIAQLAMLTGSPHAATELFRVMAANSGKETLLNVLKAMKEESLQDCPDAAGVWNVMDEVHSFSLPPDAPPLTVADFQRTALISKRYSFNA